MALESTGSMPAGMTESALEERFLVFLRRYGLSLPHLNEWIVIGGESYRVDCHWPGTDQIVELDGWRGHGTRSAFQGDRRRDRTLEAAGYSVTRVTWHQLHDEPEPLAADLRTLLTRRVRLGP